MYADDSVLCCLFPQKCKMFQRAAPAPEPAASFGTTTAWLTNAAAAAVFVAVLVVCIVGWRTRHRLWKKTHGTKTADDNTTVGAVDSGSVDKYTGSRSSGSSGGINGDSAAIEVLSEKESDYNSDWDIFEETIIRDVNLETKSGQKCEHQLCCKISFLVKKGSSVNTSRSESADGSRENRSGTSACGRKPVDDDDDDERRTTETAGPSEKNDACDHDLEFIAFRKIRFKLCKNAELTLN